MAHFSPCPESISSAVSAVGRHLDLLLSSPASRRSLQLSCTSKLTIPCRGFFEFSDHSLLSNLYWGVQTIESAVNAGSADGRNTLLANSEKMLQSPAMLDEDASTAGIDNKFIVCCSYFHLALISKLRSDEWQTATHFFQAVFVSPSCVRAELAPELYASLFGSLEINGGDEAAAGRVARRFKDSLMFYQVISYGESRSNQLKNSSSNRFFQSDEEEPKSSILKSVKKGDQLNPSTDKGSCKSTVPDSAGDETSKNDNFDIKRLQEMLEVSLSDSSVSNSSDPAEASVAEFPNQARLQENGSPGNDILFNEDLSASNITERNCLHKSSVLMHTLTCEPKVSLSGIQVQDYETNANNLSSGRSNSSRTDWTLSTLDSKVLESNSYCGHQREGDKPSRTSPRHEVRCFSSFYSKFRKKYCFSEFIHHGSFARQKINFFISEKDGREDDLTYEKARHTQLIKGFEKMILALCNSEGSRNFEDVDWQINTMREMLHNKPELRYSQSKQDILKKLLEILSSSKREREIRVSISMLLGLISTDKTIIDYIKRENLYLYNLATALKRNVHEAAILIYMLNPSPSEIRSLELLPSLVEVACNSNKEKLRMRSLSVTPTSASIAIIEILVTAFDYVTNNMHLAAISSPHVLSKLVNIVMNNNISEAVALTTILMRCMRLNGNCRKFLSQVTLIDPFIHLLGSNKMSAKSAALEYFHELLCMPRSLAVRLLHQIRQVGTENIMWILLACVKQVRNEHQLLAANLLLQLDILDGTKCKSEFAEEAIGALLESVVIGENPSIQSLSAFILSNIGGTFSWTGESYTAAWILKRAGLTTSLHKNMVRDIDWLDPCLQDSEMSTWSRKAMKIFVKFGRSVFCALAKGIQSQLQSVQRDCLITTAWLGIEMTDILSGSLQYSACQILLDEVAAFLHPGTQLDERVLACLIVYNYTSGRGKMKLLNFSEGLRESLRRLSGVTWMAEELLNVTDYVLPIKPRVSCVHTQTLEIINVGNGSATALIFYKGHLYTGYSDGSIKVWDIKEQRSMLLWEIKMHKRSVTCFTVYEAADSLLSGSTDRTVRVWKNAQKKFECVEVIQVKEPVQKVGACNEKILIVTQSRGLKVCHASRSIQTVCKNKHVTSFAVFQGKIYLGCTDSSMQEIDIVEGNEIEIKAPSTSWKIQKKPINSVCVYKGWIYCAGASVDGAGAKDWRRRKQPQISIKMPRGNNVQEMSVSEDFFYLCCSSCPETVQICLREKQYSIGRLSVGSKVTSLLTGNDMILCGTEAGLIKGWIPL